MTAQPAPERSEHVAAKAHIRAQRRFHQMIVARDYHGPLADRYTEAERLLDNLRSAVQASDPEAPDTFAISIVDPDGDPLGAALWRLAEEREMSGCGKCGSTDPVRVDATGCSDCTEFPRCIFCRRWTFDHNSVSMLLEGELVDVCDVCVDKAS